MFKVLLPNGNIGNASSVRAVCEKFVELEGEVKRVWEPVKCIESANRVSFLAGGSAYAIGNLTGGRVKSIMQKILEDGCLDCTSLELQEVSEVSEVKEGVPYFQDLGYGGDV